jgi:hypothetical protein
MSASMVFIGSRDQGSSVCDLAGRDWPTLICFDRNNGGSPPIQGNEFKLVGFPIPVNMDDGAHVAREQTFLWKSGRENRAVMFVHHHSFCSVG